MDKPYNPVGLRFIESRALSRLTTRGNPPTLKGVESPFLKKKERSRKKPFFFFFKSNRMIQRSQKADKRLPIQRIRILRLVMLRMLPRPCSTYFCLESLFLTTLGL